MTTSIELCSTDARATCQTGSPWDNSHSRTDSVSRPTILLVDDDVALTRVTTFNLEQEGYNVLTARDGETALEIVQQDKPTLVLLDVLLPGISGFEVCSRIRESSTIPVMMVSAKRSEEDVVRGLDLGADDYLSKPFDMGVLLARIKTLLRRANALVKPIRPVIAVGPLRIDFEGQEVTIAGNLVDLTRIEYRIICLLARNAGRLLTADHLLTEIWGPEYSGDNHVLSVAVARLRKKLGDNSRHPKYIVTRPGVGYMLKKPVLLHTDAGVSEPVLSKA